MKSYSPIEIPNSDKSVLDQIGKFRLEVWREETAVNEELFPNRIWLEPLDYVARHWVLHENSKLVAAARLTFHHTLEDNPDGYLWIKQGLSVPLPVVHFCKLVVHKSVRGQGIGTIFNTVRIKAAQEWGAKSIILTASEKNTRLLLSMGFMDTGIRESFPNRPGFTFKGLQYLFNS